MLRSIKDLENYEIRATDGDIGHVKDAFFDDEAWVIRYLVVETGTWLSSRKVLISPIAIGQTNWTQKRLPVSITREQVRHSPDIDTRKPVSRQHESLYSGYYGYPYYWGGTGLWGGSAYPGVIMAGGGDGWSADQFHKAQAEHAQNMTKGGTAQADDPHLRSCTAVEGYHIHATDGEIGHVSELLVDEHTWAIRYIVVDTSNWWFGHKVLIAPPWIQGVSWLDSTVSVDLTRQSVKDAPPYDANVQIGREQELGIYEHYGRAGYWADHAKKEVSFSD